MTTPQTQPFPWLLAYFRQTYPHRIEQTPDGVQFVDIAEDNLRVEALHLAFTFDGFHWTALNGNAPVFSVSPPFEGLRDPFLGRGVDGAFHLVGTGGSSRGSIIHTRSSNLVEWETPHSIPLMESIPAARNAWAPEFLYDEAAQDYLLVWSSSCGRYGWDESRIWCARTSDFLTVSPPRILFDPGFTVIDATIIPVDGRYLMFFKDERFGHRHGECRSIRIAAATHLEGPYECVGDPITPVITEGPAVMRLPDRDEWALYYDHCMDDRYAVALSRDLLTWEPVADALFPPNTRHASICPVTEAELETLRRRFP